MKPPLVIRLFSGLFIFLSIASFAILMSVGSSTSAGGGPSIGFLTAKVEYSQSPSIFTALSLLFIFAGVVDFCILLRRRYAYDVAIVYAIVSLLLLGTLAILGLGRTSDLITCAVVLLVTFGWFLFYLVRNRAEWMRGGSKLVDLDPVL